MPDGDLFGDYLAEVFSAILAAEGYVRTQGDRHGERGFVAERAPIGRVGHRQERNELLELPEYPRDGPELFSGVDPDLLKLVFGIHGGIPLSRPTTSWTPEYESRPYPTGSPTLDVTRSLNLITDGNKVFGRFEAL